MSNSKRTFLRGLLFGILSIIPAAGLAVTTSAGAMMPNGSSSSNSSMNQAVPESQQGGQIAEAAMIETPAGGASADVDVPGMNPDIDVNTGTSITPDIGVSLTSDMTPMSGGTGMTMMHQNSNGVFEAPDPVTPLNPGEDGVPVQSVPNSPPGGTIANQPPMVPNGGFGTRVQTSSVPAEQNPGVSSNGDSVVGVSVEPTHYRGGYGYNRGWYGPHGGYYAGQGYYYGGGPYYGYQPYGYYYYPSQGFYYY